MKKFVVAVFLCITATGVIAAENPKTIVLHSVTTTHPTVSVENGPILPDEKVVVVKADMPSLAPWLARRAARINVDYQAGFYRETRDFRELKPSSL